MDHGLSLMLCTDVYVSPMRIPIPTLLLIWEEMSLAVKAVMKLVGFFDHQVEPPHKAAVHTASALLSEYIVRI